MIDIRPATPPDAAQIAELVRLLGHEVTESGVFRRLEESAAAQLVAVEQGSILAFCGLGLMTVIHRERPVGRITILVVREDARGRGIGRRLVETAEEWAQRSGCGLIEITSNMRLTEAHAFYEHLGYSRTSYRLAKALT